MRRLLFFSTSLFVIASACGWGWGGGYGGGGGGGGGGGPVDRKDYSDQCQGHKTLNSNGEAVILKNPHYPEDTPAMPGLHCNWTISAPPGGYIMVNFIDVDTDGKFNITTKGKPWKFPGSKGLVSLSSAGKYNAMRVRYDCPSMKFSREFMLQLNWFPADENQTYECPKEELMSCNSTEEIGLICYNAKERCNEKNVCPDKTDEKDCGVCKGGPYVDLRDATENYSYFITSPGWPGFYANNATCLWKIEVSTDHVVIVHIQQFQLEFPYDYLQIGNSHDHGTDKWGVIRISGITKLRAVISSYHLMHLKFVSDGTIRQPGFAIAVSPINHTGILEPCEGNEYGCVDGAGVCVDRSAVCDGHQDCLNVADEQGCESVNCDGYLCNSRNHLNFTQCVPIMNVCDRKRDCPSGDDESLCHILGCPFGCECTYANNKTRDLHVQCVEGWNGESVKNASKTTHIMLLSGAHYPVLQQGMFKQHFDLRSLAMVNNSIEQINFGAFAGLVRLTWLDLSDNPITTLQGGTFRDLLRLKGLVLSNVPIQEIQKYAFVGLRGLRTMVLVTNTSLPVKVDYAGFAGLANLSKFYVDNHRLCCNFEDGGPAQCISIEPTPPLFVCGSITQTPLLRLIVWIIGLGALTGNLIVVIWRSKRVIFGKSGEDPLRVQSFLVWNLAIADFMMGIYMVVLGVADAHYGDHYYVYSEVWRDSFSCKFAGFVSLVSSEASVFFIVLISVDQFIKVNFMSSGKRISMPVAVILVLVLWIVAILFGLVAILSASPDSDVYDLSDVCIGLPLIKRPSDFNIMEGDVANPLVNRTLSVKIPGGTKPAWYFSIAIFLGLNLLCFVVISVCYGLIFAKLKKMTKAAKNIQSNFLDMVETPSEIHKTQNEVSIGQEAKRDQDLVANGVDDITKYTKPFENGHLNEVEYENGEKKMEITDGSIRDKEEAKINPEELEKDPKEIVTDLNKAEKNNDKTVEDQNVDDDGQNTAKEVQMDGKCADQNNANKCEQDKEKHHNELVQDEEDHDAVNEETGDEDETEKDQEVAEEEMGESGTNSLAGESQIESNEEQVSKMARKMFMIVLTDFCCWMPVIFMGILAQCGVNIPVVMYVWCVVLILPINSSVNPYLYTFSTCKMGSTNYVYDDESLSSSARAAQTEIYDRAMGSI